MKIKRWAWLLVSVAALGVSGIVLAQVSANYNLNWHALTGGGGTRASANYKVNDALGEWTGGSSSGSNYNVTAGFWTGTGSMTVTAPSLAIIKTGPPIVQVGGRITYTLFITNSGTGPASSLVITDALPPGANYISGGTLAGGVVSWSVADLAAGSGASLQWVVTATQPITNSEYRVSASGGYNAVGLVPVVTFVTSGGDAYEPDDSCGAAQTIANGTAQTHDIHVASDQDWVKFAALANKSYQIRVSNVGPNMDAFVMLYDACDEPPIVSDPNSFGPTIEISWMAPADGIYYLQITNNLAVGGAGTNYALSVATDTQSPSPPQPPLRAIPGDQTLIVQWRRSPDPDVARYYVRYGTVSGGPKNWQPAVEGAEHTFDQITGLTNGTPYYVDVVAEDLSGNKSVPSLEFGAVPSATADPFSPVVTLTRPSGDAIYTTTVGYLTVGGNCTDGGNNLSRIQAVNQTLSVEKWNYGLAGSSMQCLVESVPITIGNNSLLVTVYDGANNTGTDSVTVRRVTASSGVAVIVGGRKDGVDPLQTNIDYLTDHAYQMFLGAGLPAEKIWYLSPTLRDATGDGVSDVITTTTPDRVHWALQQAATLLGPNIPFYLYMMDHGYPEYFCANGCDAGGRVSAENLNIWLNEMETASGCAPDQCNFNVIIEACHSGSFIDKDSPFNSLSKSKRVVISSTDREHYAYASPQGAYFSDAFFSAVAESKSLKAAFDQAKAAVAVTSPSQQPWLDDNGNGLANPAEDGTYAVNRYIASAFGGLLPDITTAALTITGNSGVIAAQVEQGDAPLKLVWAAVFAPSFREPTTTTLNLGVPLVQLSADPAHEGQYVTTYNSFGEAGAYRVVIYAQDQSGNQAMPKLITTAKKVYLPIVLRH